ncbi:glycosyl transferase family 1 [Niallia nealsonii]|uniref:Glycosyl transferase family 1 n=2 Tax=Niallia nealsonii TaxID=115979 RepID=A0A2N0YZW7_9BACI|nr:glycosyl transferase family 1 [Niallia nealsonii]
MAQNKGFDFYQVIETIQDHSLVKGVNLIGYARAEIGVGEACRMTAKSLSTTKIPFGIINYTQEGLKEEDLSWARKEINELAYYTNVIQINADSIPDVYNHYGEHSFENHYNIGYWAWELMDFPNKWSNRFNFVDEVWAPSHFVKDSIQKKTNKPVVRIPHAISLERSTTFGREHFNLPKNCFLFLTMYDSRSYQQRKNPWGAIEAFLKAFPKNNLSVGLVLKVNNVETFPSELHKLQEAIKGLNNIYLITKPLRRSEVNSLINVCDSFISLHRSEGFGMVLAESMYLGKPVIGTDWSGNTDFMSSENSCTVHYKLVKIGNDYGPYSHNQLWADPDIEHASYYMKKIINDSSWSDLIAQKGQETILTNFSPKTVGRMINHRLLELNLI